jgi:predicted flavoprotein YhiN
VANACAVDGVEHAAGVFSVTTAEGMFRAGSLVIATGGLTVPKIGATPFGYQVAAQFGLDVVPPRPALVPLAFAPEWLARYGDLAGIALDVEASCNGGRFRENLLFTHRGLSGPAILQISSYWDGKAPLSIDLLPGAEAIAWLRDQRKSSARIDNVLSQRLSRRFVDAWCAEHGQLVGRRGRRGGR